MIGVIEYPKRRYVSTPTEPNAISRAGGEPGWRQAGCSDRIQAAKRRSSRQLPHAPRHVTARRSSQASNTALPAIE